MCLYSSVLVLGLSAINSDQWDVCGGRRVSVGGGWRVSAGGGGRVSAGGTQVINILEG